MKWQMAACALLLTASSFTAALAESPRDFVQKTIERDNSEIMLGRLAEHGADNPAVRNFAQALVADHMRSKARALALGRVLGIPPAEGPTSDALDERNNLMGLHGRDFDSEFVHYTIDKHNDEISDCRDQADNDHGPAGQLAADALPALHAQLQNAKAIEQREDL